MKKLLTLMMTVTVVAVLAACGGNENAEPATEEAPVEVDAEAGNEAGNEAEAEAGHKEFTVTATNFEFTSDIELVVNKGDLVTIHVTNEEGVHGIAIEEFDAVGGPGETIEFEATEAGTFELVCSVQCGEGHDDMKTSLVVLD
ncbi:cytochrome C oxidase subunit II [Bacillaceae bacterium IKA-2]|nr:cytochrome C oxidase subunit II [Bacillaceae bacterium IKA-2]